MANMAMASLAMASMALASMALAIMNMDHLALKPTPRYVLLAHPFLETTEHPILGLQQQYRDQL